MRTHGLAAPQRQGGRRSELEHYWSRLRKSLNTEQNVLRAKLSAQEETNGIRGGGW